MKFEWASKEYAQDVYEQFKSYVITPPREQKRINTSGNENITWCFQTIVHPDLDYLGDLFLQDGALRAVLNSKVYENISPQTLACWFMDDGGVAIHMVFNSIHKVLAILKLINFVKF